MPGARNRRTTALLAIAEAGETPCGFALRIMRDESQAPDLRMMAAKIAAPYVHSKPQPEPRLVEFEIPVVLGPGDLAKVHETVIRAVAAGDLAVEDAKDISATLETHRRIVETAELEARIARLEQEQSK